MKNIFVYLTLVCLVSTSLFAQDVSPDPSQGTPQPVTRTRSAFLQKLVPHVRTKGKAPRETTGEPSLAQEQVSRVSTPVARADRSIQSVRKDKAPVAREGAMRRKMAPTVPQAKQTTGPRPISRRPEAGKLVALTYDDGPNPVITPKLLALLRQKNARATFFLLGDSVRAYPHLAKEIADAGMEIGNHSDTHRQFTKLTESQISAELQTAEQRIKDAAPGVEIKVMRPPYGAYNSTVMRVAQQMGYKVILWDVDTNDWRKKTTEEMTRTILSGVRNGSIILMHDRYQTSLETTAAVLDQLGAQGYRFVTVSELLAAPAGDSSSKQDVGK